MSVNSCFPATPRPFKGVVRKAWGVCKVVAVVAAVMLAVACALAYGAS